MPTVSAPAMPEYVTKTDKRYGKYAAVVVDNVKPQNADHRGEITVRIEGLLEEDPNDPMGLTSRKMEVLARPCLPPGFFYIPEPGDHVWVEFGAGKVDDPIWSGVWYPDGQPPQTPDGNAPTQDQKVIRTRKGHVVLLDDADNAERVVVLEGKNKNTITCDQNGIIIEDKNKNRITMSSNGIEVLDKNQNKLTMDSNGMTLLHKGGQRKITLDSSNVKLE
jgi:uncharacterized protein involved in type VI secretion and phage assembly